MIKKFKDYIKESKRFVDRSITEIFPPYEIEDQFLRLKEVFNCKIYFTDELFNNVESVPNKSGDLRWPGPEVGGPELKQVICAKIIFKDVNAETILEELCDIKRRLEHAYPIKMHTNSLKSNTGWEPGIMEAQNSGEENFTYTSFIEPRKITHKSENNPIDESNRTYSAPSQIDMKDILKTEDVEDQFLRLKEVFGCEIRCKYVTVYRGEYDIEIIMDHTELWNSEKFEKIKEELHIAKRRLKSMYPVRIQDHQSGTYWKMTIFLK